MAHSPPQPRRPSAARRALGFLRRHALPAGLLFAVGTGVAWPGPGRAAAGVAGLSLCLLALIFGVTGLLMDTASVRAAVKSWKFGLVSLLVILVATPFAAGPLLLRVPLDPPELSVGLALFGAMPCTMSSGVVLVGIAGGSEALAVMVTVAASMLAVFTVPAILPVIFRTASLEGEFSIDAASLLLRLMLIVLVPVLAGRALRSVPCVRAFARRHGPTLKIVSLCALISIPWMKASEASSQLRGARPGPILAAWAAGLAAHLLYLAMAAFAAFVTGAARPVRICMTILASEKTLGFFIAVLDLLGEDAGGLGTPGLILLPAVIAHFTQILVDAWIAGRYASETRRLRADAGEGDADGPGEKPAAGGRPGAAPPQTAAAAAAGASSRELLDLPEIDSASGAVEV